MTHSLETTDHPVKIKVRDLRFTYRETLVLDRVNVNIPDRCITSISGPSGQGKSSFLTVLNRLWENIESAKPSATWPLISGRGLRTSMPPGSACRTCGRRWAWSFRPPTPCP
jgi:phosphate transport system ATP-binding protein